MFGWTGTILRIDLSKGTVTREATDAACGFSAHDETDAQGTSHVRVLPRKGKGLLLDARYGAGLDGLPFPASPSAASKALSPARKTR